MADLTCILLSLEVPSAALKSDILQKVLLELKKINVQLNDSDKYLDLYSKILLKLWSHLQAGLNEFDDQLLCSTCFYTVLSMIEMDNTISNLMLQNINNELSKSDNTNESKEKTLSIIYGMFQSNFLTQKGSDSCCILRNILNSAFNLLTGMAYEYSHYRTIVFKILVSLKKVLGTNLQDVVLNKHNQLRLLDLVNHNWENSINGTRNWNKFILQIIISVADNNMLKAIIEEVNEFYWNKAKYLTFSEIIDKYNGKINTFLKKYNLIDGLLHSLHKPGLVSAGADMYYSVLKKLHSEEEWEAIFMNKIMEIFCPLSQKAMNNFINYWCLTTLKRFPLVGQLILNSLQKSENSEQRLNGILSVMRQCNKQSLIKKNWNRTTDIEENILCGLEHCNPQIRIAAFDLVCVSHDKSWPNEVEYEIILNFLSDNVNSDCTVLRLSMLNSLNSFLNHIQALHLNNANSIGNDKDNLLSFCARLQDFIIISLNLNGNYQRKITTVKIASTVLNCVTEIPKKRQKQLKQTNYVLMEFVSDNGKWILFNEKIIEKLISLLSDPAEDIRENVLQLLLIYYRTQLKQPIIIDQIIEKALFKIKSKFFYEISCAQSMFKLLVKIVLKEGCIERAMFGNVEEIFHFAYTELLTEYNAKRDIMESIEDGKQLHSNICILSAIFEACLQSSYRLKICKDTILALLDILEGVSNQFVWEQDVSTSSDFSKMSDMVRQIIEKSGYTSTNEDNAKITGLEQIVLNCLWLNVKASCELAALVIKYCDFDIYLDTCEKSLHVITNVLETSRHKGAIEAAGVALGDAIQHLTTLPAGNQLTDLPMSLLKQKLNELILEANDMASVTRRGAGLSIMVHRIVSNDMRKKKTLFHYFINTLLETCKKLDNDANDLTVMRNLDDEKDLPKAIYIHFLTRIVTDSSLITEVMYYSAKLAELAFENLTSPHWQIRNAALQLYGGLIPKLIGQKKPSGSEDEVTATVACDEFRTHFPQLWMFILNQLKVNDSQNLLQSHSNLLPILNTLGNIAKRYNYSNDLNAQLQDDNDLLKSLRVLLGSPIHTIRRLTAKCIFNIYSFDTIYKLLVEIERPKENFLHGCLLLLLYSSNYYKDSKYQNQFEILKNKLNDITFRPHSYICKELVENVVNKMYTFSDLEDVLLHTDLNEPGQFQWINSRIRKYLQNCPWVELPQCVQMILATSEYEKHCEILYARLDMQIDIDYLVLKEISDILLTFPKRMCSFVLWKILYKISCLIKLDCDDHINNRDIIEYLKNDNSSYKLRFIIPFIARVTIKEDTILVVTKIIQKLCNPEESDVDMRMISAFANNELAHKISKLSDETKIISIMTAVILLQDEEEDVRNISVHYYSNLKKMSTILHPYICLRKILNYKLLSSLLCDPKTGINNLSQQLTDLLSSINIVNSDEFNPFANESKNIYQEVEIVHQLIGNLKVDLQ